MAFLFEFWALEKLGLVGGIELRWFVRGVDRFCLFWVYCSCDQGLFLISMLSVEKSCRAVSEMSREWYITLVIYQGRYTKGHSHRKPKVERGKERNENKKINREKGLQHLYDFLDYV